MRLVRRLSLLGFLLAPLLVLAACGDDGADLDTDYPSAGEDRFENTSATVEIEVKVEGVGALPVAIGAFETIDLEGPALIKRGDPGDSDGDGLADIETEIVSMELTGTHPLLGPVTVSQDPERPSMGMVEQQERGQDFPADSFFDVFVEVQLQDMNLVAVNEDSLRMEATLTALPPGESDGEDDAYRTATGETVPLIVPTEQNRRIGSIVDALHIPNPGPGPMPGAGETPEPTPTTAPTPTPTEEPAAQQVEVQVAAGCEHTQPGVQSDLVALVLAALVGAAPVEGATVEASADGPGVIESTASGVTDANGEAQLRFPINLFGEYDIMVEQVIGSDGTPLEIAPGSQTSTTYEVTDLCTLPFGFDNARN